MGTKTKGQSTLASETQASTKQKRMKVSVAAAVTDEAAANSKLEAKPAIGKKQTKAEHAKSDTRQAIKKIATNTDEVKREVKRDLGYRPWDSDCDTPAIFFVTFDEAATWIEERREMGHAGCEMALERFFENPDGWLLSITAMVDASTSPLTADRMVYPPVHEAAVIGRVSSLLPEFYQQDQKQRERKPDATANDTVSGDREEAHLVG